MSSPKRFVALQHRDFRLLWFGRLVSAIGTSMQIIAVNWHVVELLSGRTYRLSLLGRDITLGAEALGLGLLGLVRVLPIIAFALVGGMVADNADRRRILMWAQGASLLFSTALAVTTLTGRVSLTIVYALSAAGAAATAFDAPARQSLVPNIVPRRHLTNAVSLDSLLHYVANVGGPAVAGLIIAAAGVGAVYAVDAVSFLVVLGALWLMDYRRAPDARSSGYDWSALVDGLRFTYRTRLIWSTMLLDFLATFFSSARTMLPLVARDILGVGAQGYGLLATAQPIGAIVAGVVLSLRREIHHQGIVLLVSVAVYGVATALFGLSTAFALSYFLFSLTGAGDTVSMVIRGTIRQLVTPDHLRGRMTSVNMIFFMGGPQLGELEAGLVASALGVPLSIFTGGVATVLLTLWVAWRYPRLRNYKVTHQEQPALA